MRPSLAAAAALACAGCGVKAPPRPPTREGAAAARESPAPVAAPAVVPGTLSGPPADAPPDGGATGAHDGGAP
jgi:hypothetical protein